MATKVSHQNSHEIARRGAHRVLSNPLGYHQHEANRVHLRGCQYRVYDVVKALLEPMIGRKMSLRAWVQISLDELSTKTGYCKRAVINAINYLQNQGILIKDRHWQWVQGQRVCLPNSYSINPPSAARMAEYNRIRADRYLMAEARRMADRQRLERVRVRAQQRRFSRAANALNNGRGGSEPAINVQPNIDLFSSAGVAPSLETVLYNGQMWHRDALKRCLEIQRRR